MYKFVPERLQAIFGSPIRRATFESVMTGVAGQAVLIISGIIVARALGPEGRGYLALLVIFPAILSQLGSLGLPQATTYFIARDDEETSEVYNVVKMAFFIQMLVLVAIHFFIVALYVRHEPKEVVLAGYITLAVIPGMLAQQYGLAVLQGWRDFRAFNILRLMPATVYAVLVLLLFLSRTACLPSIVVTWIFSIIGVGFITACLARSVEATKKKIESTSNPTNLSEMLKFGLKGLIGTLSPMQNFRLDQLVAGLFLSPVALGLYVVGQAFTNIIRFIAQSVGMVAYPSVAAVGAGPNVRQLIWRFFAGVSVLNGAVALALILLMPILVPFLFGKAFSGSIPIARLLLVGSYFDSLRRILVEGMRGLGRPEVSTWTELSMYPWLATVGLYLVVQYGIRGLAAAVMIGYALSFGVSAIYYSRKLSSYASKPANEANKLNE